MYVGAIELKDDLVIFDASAISAGYFYHFSLVPLSTLFTATGREYHGDSRHGHYMTSWLLVRHLLDTSGPAARDALVTLAKATAKASSPQEQAAAVSVALAGRPVTEIEAQITSTYQRARWGVAQATKRRTRAVTITRPAERQLSVEAVDPAEVRFLYRALMGLDQ
jgi:hypothetical protein